MNTNYCSKKTTNSDHYCVMLYNHRLHTRTHTKHTHTYEFSCNYDSLNATINTQTTVTSTVVTLTDFLMQQQTTLQMIVTRKKIENIYRNENDE
jgi:hypothetical protein